MEGFVVSQCLQPHWSYFKSIIALKTPFPFQLTFGTKMLSKHFSFSGYVGKLDIYDIIKHFSESKYEFYWQEGVSE